VFLTKYAGSSTEVKEAPASSPKNEQMLTVSRMDKEYGKKRSKSSMYKA
jgi:hypothetical protein